MGAEAVAFSRSWKVGRYTATLTMPKTRPGEVQSAVIEWEPELPNHLTVAELTAYRQGRNAAMAALAESIGANATEIGRQSRTFTT